MAQTLIVPGVTALMLAHAVSLQVEVELLLFCDHKRELRNSLPWRINKRTDATDLHVFVSMCKSPVPYAYTVYLSGFF